MNINYRKIINLKIVNKKICFLTAILLLTISFSSNNINAKGNTDFIEEIISNIDENLVENYIQTLQDFGLKETGTNGCTNAGNYLYDEFQNMGLDVQFLPWVNGDYEDRNIEAILPGENEECVIISGHLDTVHESSGADDNCAGIAAVLSAAKTITEYMEDNKLFYTIRFIAFTGKEQGLFGSYDYANNAKENGMKIKAHLGTDMLGYTRNLEDGRTRCSIYRERYTSTWIAEVSDDVAFYYSDLIGLEINRRTGGAISDFHPFMVKGYSSVFYHEYYFNDYWHTPEDTIDKLDMEYCARVTRMIVGTLLRIADNEFENLPPNKPEIPTGPNSGEPNIDYNFTVTVFDPEDNQVFFRWDWGDGQTSGWIGPYYTYPRGAECTISHNWSNKGNYEVKVKSKDIHGTESEWSDPLTISMPKSKTFTYPIIRHIFQKIYQYFNPFLIKQNVIDLHTYENQQLDNEINVLAVIPNNYGAFTLHHLNNYGLMGWNITTTATTESVHPCHEGSRLYDLPDISVDVIIDDINNIEDYDILALMPSPANDDNCYNDILRSRNALDLFSDAKDNNLIIWATCAGPRVLATADVIDGVKIQGSQRFKKEYEDSGAIYVGNGQLPTIDGNIVTMTNGWYYNKEGCEAIETSLQNKSYTNQKFEIEINNIKSNLLSYIPTLVDSIIWEKNFGGIKRDGARSVYPTNDGGAISTGYTFSFGGGNTDIYVVKLDENGDEEWSNTYGSTGWEYGNSIYQTNDNGYVITGYCNDDGSNKNVCLLKLDMDGNEQWFKQFGGLKVDIGCSVCELDDESLMICGFTESYGAGESDVYLLKITSQGEIIWEKTFGGAEADRGHQLFKTSTGNIIIVGSTGSFGHEDNYDFYFISIDSDGNQIWANTYGVPGPYGYDCGYSICETDDNGFIIVGEYALYDIGNIEVLKIDLTGEVIRRKYFGDDFLDFGTSICKTDDGNYLISGSTKTRSDEWNDILLVKIDSDLNEIWKKVIEYPGWQWCNSICMTNDGNYVFVGDTETIGIDYENIDFWIVKFSSIDSQPPEKPERPYGTESGRTGGTYTYSSTGIDPDDDDIYYLFDWGDGSDSNWLGPYRSGTNCSASHSWSEDGDYFIKVRTKDIHGYQSEWSETQHITMPKNTIFYFLQKINFLKIGEIYEKDYFSSNN